MTSLKLFILLIAPLLSSPALTKELTHVKIVFIEALAPADTTSSKRFRSDYQRAASIASAAIRSKLAQCGYDISTEYSFYEARDPIQAKEKAQESENGGAWLIVGPRRSNHYLLAVTGASKTPTISLLASTDEIEKLGPLHTTLSPLNSSLVRVAVKEAANKLTQKNKTFIAITNEDCISCREFSHQFILLAEKSHLKLIKEIKVTGDLPETKGIIDEVDRTKPTFILLPSYSKTTSHIMSALRPHLSGTFYVGGDGWGDSKFGFVQNGKNLDGVQGITVRGYPPSDIGLQTFAFGRHLLSKLRTEELPSSSPSLGIIKIFSTLPSLLCNAKTKTKESFTEEFSKLGKKEFHSPFGVSIFGLEEGQLTYLHSRNL